MEKGIDSRSQEDNSRQWEELRILYQVAVSDIEYAKNQQWSVTNYGVGAYVAIAAIFQLVKQGGISDIERYIFASLGMLVMVIGIWLIGELDKTITKRRDRLERIISQFTETAMIAFQYEGITKKQKQSNILVRVFQGVFALGCIFLGYLLFRLS